jgi:hypothetical protein
MLCSPKYSTTSADSVVVTHVAIVPFYTKMLAGLKKYNKIRATSEVKLLEKQSSAMLSLIFSGNGNTLVQ